ncbi:ATP synthase F1 subunit gamma [Scatolibacter rhodanostii]|uniref:ATP synthase F1 subunit gamma n=1 Tax=Scatolibacter rhodanostii TaxID=2014781 RepID=UPI000C07DBE7|nr:ATP synthase F1 subunit gamma [Scatolibacter rhodanostii]
MADGKGLEIKTRMHSIEGTRKITKAMGLVASSKIARAKERVERSRPYFQIMYDTLHAIADSNTDFGSPYVKENTAETVCLIVLGGDRGLAGGYNGNLFKKAEEISAKSDYMVLPIGKKCLDFFERKNAEIISREYAVAADLTVGRCFEISRTLCDLFLRNEFHKIVLVYTNFVSMLEQTPADIQVLPLMANSDVAKKETSHSILYEPSGEAVFDAIVPEYMAGLLYGALCESLAAEQAARHTAMDSASKNAEEMLDTLVLQYNRARQGSITQEITEIIAGSGE